MTEKPKSYILSDIKVYRKAEKRFTRYFVKHCLSVWEDTEYADLEKDDC